ncbi:hypothetical protein GCK72_000417 [Caenorhabditis remanei]|uniref:Uncharacterized protein n=1 Tax=Caenorhabditis remanei TaxID=31234 RepID=A0A6A5HM16_CAERE|nr:hypothetical protein GCK72_000417 [Caenorhabditis remanei]KAF1768605.1 hypothetical protein GCK72_000417 [Caenorhabditis remanei]
MRLPILLLTLAVMATAMMVPSTATIYWKHPVRDANQEVKYQLKLITDALNNKDIELFEKLVNVFDGYAEPILGVYASEAGYIVYASKTAEGGLYAMGRLVSLPDRFTFKWELNAESPSGYKLVECRELF